MKYTTGAPNSSSKQKYYLDTEPAAPNSMRLDPNSTAKLLVTHRQLKEQQK
jgi:hypothetical protein